MNLLVITNNPDRASFRQRIGIYLDALGARGINCEVAKLPAGSLKRWSLFERSADFDGVFLHKKSLNFFDARILVRYSKKIIYDFDDAIMFRHKNPDAYSRSHFGPFRKSIKQYDLVIAGNPYLAGIAQKYNSNVTVLATGLDTSDYPQTAVEKDADGKIRLVWIGSKSTLCYLAQIKEAFEDLAGRFDNVVLRIICDEFFDLENMPVEKHHWSLKSQAIDLVGCDIGLAPLPDNRFTRGKCGFKILQYAAAGLPVVASPVGVNSDYIDDGVSGFLATDKQQWIEKIETLIKDEQLRKTMGQRAKEAVVEFDVANIGKKLADLIINCL